ncbi:MAG: SEC-C metal-binding domain-containing protein [Bacillus sp. (in: firmicutes)]
MNVEVKDEYKLGTLLNSLNMEQLKNIRRNLELKNMSSLRKKELVAALEENIPQSIENVVEMMDVDRYTAVLRLMSKSGIIEMDQLEMEDVFYLSSIGYIHPAKQEEQPVLVMPQEVMAKFYDMDPAELKGKLNRNQKITNLLFGMMRTYGMIETAVAQAMVEEYISETIDAKWFVRYVDQLEQYYTSFRISGEYIIAEAIEDEEKLKQQRAMRTGLEYRRLPEQMMFTMNRHETYNRTSQLQELAQYITKHYGLAGDQLEEIMEECVSMIQRQETMPEIVGMFGKFIAFKDMADLQQFVPKLVSAMNNTRLWSLKGHTPNELSPQPQAQAGQSVQTKKVGRNEPCPCGSGKKYKKCCGK